MARRRKSKQVDERAYRKVSGRKTAKSSLFDLALDTVAQLQTSGLPLDKLVNENTRRERLGKSERARLGDILFTWSRRKGALDKWCDAIEAKFGGRKPQARERHRIQLAAAAQLCGQEIDYGELADAYLQPFADGIPDLNPALPTWLEKKILENLPDDESKLFLKSLSERPPLWLAVDLRNATVAEMIAALSEQDIDCQSTPTSHHAIRVTGRYSLHALPDNLRHAAWPMDLGSQLVVLELGDVEGERVLDLCAGGGGKAQLLESRGAKVVAVDISKKRLAAAKARLQDAEFLCADGRAPPLPKNSFTKVLVDAPCSGTGTLKRAPDIAIRLSDARVDELRQLQLELLRSALELCAPDGRVVYATCSLLREENEGIIESVVSEGLANCIHSRTLWPHRDETDGFFIASLSPKTREK